MRYHLKCRKLYKVARNIFGNVVISAYVESIDKKDLQKISENYSILKDDDECLCYDNDTIVLEFSNGNKVRFSNSEWASMTICRDFNAK